MNDEGLADVEAANPNQRWCSDVFLIPCWSGEVISVAFAIDCHDREVSGLRRVAAAADGRRQSHADGPHAVGAIWRGDAEGAARRAVAFRQWPAVHGDGHGALRPRAGPGAGHHAGVQPAESNGLAEAFVNTFKRDYVDGAELRDAESVLAQLSTWFEDYNTRAPHSALGMRSPADYRAEGNLSSSR